MYVRVMLFLLAVDYESSRDEGAQSISESVPKLTAKRYANEVGESLRPIIHKNWVRLSYGVAFAYVLVDTVDKTRDASRIERAKEKYNTSTVVKVGADTLLWQTLASVAIPGFTINRICALSLYILSKTTNMSSSTRKWTTTAIGLACIPFIVKPIDHGVDKLMDNTVREWASIRKSNE